MHPVETPNISSHVPRRFWQTSPVWVLGFVAILSGGCMNPRSNVPLPAESPDGPAPARAGDSPSGGGAGAGGSGGGGGSSSSDDAAGSPQGTSGTGGDGSGTSAPPGTDACPSGQHRCGGLCIDSKSPSTCGVSCDPCPQINGGTTTCDGIKCGVTCPPDQTPCKDSCVGKDAACDGKCPTGQNLCNNLCVDAKNLNFCGTACTPCPTSANGKASCDGDKCDLQCSSGFHKCNGGCVSDKAPQSCGVACSACPVPMGGTATCDGTSCGASCPSGSKLCLGNCIGNDKACNGVCAPGNHDCSGNCVSNDKTTSCGTSACTPCTPPKDADATCDGARCGFKCRAGFHQCSMECRDDTSASSCGSLCTACPMPANAKPTCKSGQCDFDCTSGRRCHDQCVDSSQPCDGACGPGTSLCMASGRCVPSGTITAEICDGQDNDCNGKIDDLPPVRCSSSSACGYKTCNGKSGWSTSSCKDMNSKASCGSSCAPCVGGSVDCIGGKCKSTCTGGKVGDPCACPAGKADCGGACATAKTLCVAWRTTTDNLTRMTYCEAKSSGVQFDCGTLGPPGVMGPACVHFSTQNYLYYSKFEFHNGDSTNSTTPGSPIRQCCGANNGACF